MNDDVRFMTHEQRVAEGFMSPKERKADERPGHCTCGKSSWAVGSGAKVCPQCGDRNPSMKNYEGYNPDAKPMKRVVKIKAKSPAQAKKILREEHPGYLYCPINTPSPPGNMGGWGNGSY